jgi:hypothetical protein
MNSAQRKSTMGKGEKKSYEYLVVVQERALHFQRRQYNLFAQL